MFTPYVNNNFLESPTTGRSGGLDFFAIGKKNKGTAVT
jgi:hypothetical protein